jgi:uncharacterized phage protein gp47/JayE
MINTVASYINQHPDPNTGVLVGRPAGIEVIIFKLTLKPVQMAIKLTPNTSETQSAVLAQLRSLFIGLAPADTLLLSQIRTAIGRSYGVSDYECDLTDNITSDETELLVLGEITWA